MFLLQINKKWNILSIPKRKNKEYIMNKKRKLRNFNSTRIWYKVHRAWNRRIIYYNFTLWKQTSAVAFSIHIWFSISSEKMMIKWFRWVNNLNKFKLKWFQSENIDEAHFRVEFGGNIKTSAGTISVNTDSQLIQFSSNPDVHQAWFHKTFHSFSQKTIPREKENF